jgi:hypothetical protein
MLSQGHISAPHIITQAKVAPNFGILGHLWSGNDAIGCHYIMVEADIHLRLLPTSILDKDNVLEPLVCCLKGIWVHPYIVIPAKLAPDFGIWVTCGLKLIPLHHG